MQDAGPKDVVGAELTRRSVVATWWDVAGRGPSRACTEAREPWFVGGELAARRAELLGEEGLRRLL